jgi:hypothetical protein
LSRLTLVAEKLIYWSKNRVESIGEIETLKSIQKVSFSDRLHFVARTFYFRQVLNENMQPMKFKSTEEHAKYLEEKFTKSAKANKIKI